MNIRIVQNRFSFIGGRTIPLLVVDDELELYSAGYLIQCLNNGRQPPTLLIYAKGIMALYRFCEARNINIHERLRKLDNLRMTEIEDLSTWLSVNHETGELQADGTYKLRMRAVRAFIYFFWDTYQSRASNNAEHLNHARYKREVMVNAFKTVEDAPFSRPGKNLQGLSPELQAKFLEIIVPLQENELNPYKSNHVRWRNYILLLTMMLGGNRRSESILMQLQDVNLYGREKYFEIVKRNNILPQKSQHSQAAAVKTKGRTIGLNEELASLFEYYLTHIRRKFKGHAKSMDLFLSTKEGKPLSVNTPNAIVESIVKKHPEFKGILTPHRLRNTFHDLLNDALDKKMDADLGNQSPMMKQSHKQVLQEQAGGWARGSAMTSKYPAGSIERRVIAMTQTAQTLALNPSQKVNKDDSE